MQWLNRISWNFGLLLYFLYVLLRTPLLLNVTDILAASQIRAVNVPCPDLVDVNISRFRYDSVWHNLIYSVMIAQLTHCGRVMHKCVRKLAIIDSDNGLSPDRRQAIIWTNAGILLTGPLGTNVSEILIEILTFLFKKMRLNTSSAKWRPFCLGLNVLNPRPSLWLRCRGYTSVKMISFLLTPEKLWNSN